MRLKANTLSCDDHLISSYYPNYFIYKFCIASFSFFFFFFFFFSFLGETERRQTDRDRDVPSKESMGPLSPDGARLESPFGK